MLIRATALDLVASTSYDEGVIDSGRTAARALAGEAFRPDSDPAFAQAVVPTADVAADGRDDGVVADLRPPATGRPLHDVAEAGTGVFRIDDVLAGEAGGPGEPVIAREPELGDFAPIAGMMLAANSIPGRFNPSVPLPTVDAGTDEGDRRPGVDKEAEREGEEADAGLGASLALSVIKESAFAELARSFATGGGGAACWRPGRRSFAAVPVAARTALPASRAACSSSAKRMRPAP